jgi:threonine synthase
MLDIIHDTSGMDAVELRAIFAARESAPWDVSAPWTRSGVWRFRELVMPATDDSIVTYPEGNTPLLAREKLARWSGLPGLLIKHEGLNPSGSFKDRGMAVALSQAKRVGATAVACASTGNTSSSLAAYAGITGTRALVLVPAGRVAPGKLAQTVAYGARTLAVRGDFDDCLRLVREAQEKLGVYLVNSVNPFRVEGQKTIVLELLQQLDWRAPDWIAVPAGNLGNAAAFGKAIVEAAAIGLIDRKPRLLLVQAAGANPFALSFRQGFRTRHVVHAETVASAIRIGNPASYERAVRSVRETDGVVVDVTDAEIMEAKAVIDASGIGCEPASAASVAGLRKMVGESMVKREEKVVAILTGNLLKDPGPVASEVRDLPEIDATLRALEDALSRD